MLEFSELWSPIRLTIELAAITTVALLVIGTPIAWWLARSRSRFKEIVATVVALPLVLPPTVLGFYLLVALGPEGPGGAIAGLYGARSLAFTFEGLVIGSVFYSMPFVVQPIRNAFEAFGERPLEGLSFGHLFDKFACAALGFSQAHLQFGSIVDDARVFLFDVVGERRDLAFCSFDFAPSCFKLPRALLFAQLRLLELSAQRTVLSFELRHLLQKSSLLLLKLLNLFVKRFV